MAHLGFADWLSHKVSSRPASAERPVKMIVSHLSKAKLRIEAKISFNLSSQARNLLMTVAAAMVWAKMSTKQAHFPEDSTQSSQLT